MPKAAIFDLDGTLIDSVDQHVGDTPYDAEAAGKARLRTIDLLCQ